MTLGIPSIQLRDPRADPDNAAGIGTSIRLKNALLPPGGAGIHGCGTTLLMKVSACHCDPDKCCMMDKVVEYMNEYRNVVFLC